MFIMCVCCVYMTIRRVHNNRAESIHFILLLNWYVPLNNIYVCCVVLITTV